MAGWLLLVSVALCLIVARAREADFDWFAAAAAGNETVGSICLSGHKALTPLG